MKRLCIGIAGGTGSGKTTLAHAVAARFPGDAVVIEHDAYYRDQRHLEFAARLRTNYDHPDALETARLITDLRRLLDGETIEVPCYDFTRHLRSETVRTVAPHPIVIVEGIHTLGDPELRALMAFRIYVDAPDDLRFIRRLQRDVAERGRTVNDVIRQYIEQVRPMHGAFVEPEKAHADSVVSGEIDVEAVAAQVASQLAKLR
jgi:uridine kinase